MTKRKYNKSEIMKTAWFYFKKGWYKSNFSVCLSKAWEKAKEKALGIAKAVFTDANLSKETEKAYGLSTDFGVVWCPKSAVIIVGSEIYIKEWFLQLLDSQNKRNTLYSLIYRYSY